ncbi:MAG: hypothetical protein KGJ90_05125 [Patescibacteria group bacterium]|nr:hypothetical protein [Patescibacteria group bacterium]
MTLPTVYPTGFNGTVTDLEKGKSDRSGALRSSVVTVTVPTTTASATVIGLVPIKKGGRLVLPACRLAVDALDSTNNLTTSIGIVYQDTANNTSVPTKYNSSSTTGQAGGTFTLLTTDAADSYVATGSGWVAVTTGVTATNTQGTIHGVITITYDSLLQ